MEDVKKYVDISYILTGVMFAWLGIRIFEAVWSLMPAVPNPEVFADVTVSTILGIFAAFCLTLYLRIKPSIYQWVTESGVELKKTIWPNWDETKSNTKVVIIVTAIIGIVLWLFDVIWRGLTGFIY